MISLGAGYAEWFEGVQKTRYEHAENHYDFQILFWFGVKRIRLIEI